MQAKVAIVEDNLMTIRSLVETIRWEDLGCTIVGTAMDGLSGEELLRDTRPDILLTDIRMPQEDGLKMVEMIREELPDLKVIIITGYDHFQYAAQAIRLSVFDYILKPIQNEEVIRAVNRALEVIRREKEEAEAVTGAAEIRMKAQLLSLLTNDAHAGQDVGLMVQEANLLAKAYYLMIIQPDGAQPPEEGFMNRVDALLEDPELKAVSVVLYDSMVVYVMRQDTGEGWKDEARRVADRVSEGMPGKTRIGISALSTSRHRIRQTYQEARQALWEDTAREDGRRGTFFGGEEGAAGSPMAEMRRKVDELIARAELTESSARDAASALVGVSGRQYSYLRALVSLYALLLIRKFSCPTTDEIERAMGGVWYVSNEENVTRCLNGLYEAIRNASQPEGSCSLLTRSVLDYIRLHGAEALRLNEVAEKFQVSSNYLSALIRRETGVTFHDHVLRAKMDIAHTMLADPRILVEEVAWAVGYSNYISFYNTFKRLEHMTPSEYRNMLAT